MKTINQILINALQSDGNLTVGVGILKPDMDQMLLAYDIFV